MKIPGQFFVKIYTLTSKCHAEAMKAAYQDYSKQNGLPLDENFVDWGNVPEGFEREWDKAREAWFTDVSKAAGLRELSLRLLTVNSGDKLCQMGA